MSNGIDGWITDKVSSSVDAVREAVEREAYEARKQKKEAEDSISKVDDTLKDYEDIRVTGASEQVHAVDIAWQEYLAEMGGNTRNLSEQITASNYRAFKERVALIETEDLESWETIMAFFDKLFGEGYDPLINIDTLMPSGLSGLGEGLGGIMGAIFQSTTLNLETYLEDGLKLYVANKQLAERIKEEEGGLK